MNIPDFSGKPRLIWYFLLIVALIIGCQGQIEETIEAPTQILPSTVEVQPTSVPTEKLAPTDVLTPAATPIPYQTPDWFQNAVLYEIFVRSFADSNGDGTGDLKGIIERLDYLDCMHVDVIWLLPIYPSPSVHGYDVENYFDINPDYGTLTDLEELVEAAHERDIRVILDFVPSHLSNKNPLFEDAYQNPKSEYSDWFVWTNDAHTTYAGFADNRDMPRFNHFNPEVVNYLVEAALFWLDLDSDGDYTDGVDGFRVDNVTFPPEEFLRTFRQGVKAANPNALILGEAWLSSPSDLSRFFEDKFDALFDFPLYQLLQGDQNFNGDGLLAGRTFPVLLTTLLEQEAESYPEEGMVVRFLSNHDTNRIATELAGDRDRQKMAAALLASLPGPVMVYYGEEIGMFGQKGGAPYWDNYRREPMDWYADEIGDDQTEWFKPEDRWNRPDDGISVEEQETDPESVLSYYCHVLNLRYNVGFIGSDFEILDLDVSSSGPWGFLRKSEHGLIIALYNFSDEERQVTIPEPSVSIQDPIDMLTGESYPPLEIGRPYKITMVAAKALWLSEKE
ncbi:MAG: alpha-amylase family glycosyl hydrolase [Anaerolineales bacterium]|jgi:glycosidase